MMKEKEIYYSVIIPHYNCVSLLNRCLTSIPERDDIEIIVIDDNSNDDNRPLSSNANVRIIYLGEADSHGAGHARNVGIMTAKGKWLLFADADDYFTDNLNCLLDKYLNDEVTDIVYLNAQNVDEYGIISSSVVSAYIDNYLNNRLYSASALRYNIWSPWTRMVKRRLVEEYAIFFDNIPMGNDMMFCLKCSKYAKRFCVEEMVIYSYLNPIGRSETEKNRCKIKNIKYKVELSIRQNELYDSVGYLFKSNYFTGLRNIPNGVHFNSYKKEYKRILREYKINIVKDLYNVLLYRIGLLLKILK